MCVCVCVCDLQIRLGTLRLRCVSFSSLLHRVDVSICADVSQAALLSADVGFDSLWFMRIDYQDRNTRLANKTMQFMWRPSVSLGPAAQVLTGAFITGYGPPSGFCYDQSCSDTPIQDDPRLSDVNVDFLVDLFVNRQAHDIASSREAIACRTSRIFHSFLAYKMLAGRSLMLKCQSPTM